MGRSRVLESPLKSGLSYPLRRADLLLHKLIPVLAVLVVTYAAALFSARIIGGPFALGEILRSGA